MKRKIKSSCLILGLIILPLSQTVFSQTAETNFKVPEQASCPLITKGIEFCVKTPFISVEKGKEVFITYSIKNVTDQGIKTRFGRNSSKEHFTVKMTDENKNKVLTILEELIEKRKNENSDEGFIFDVQAGRGPASLFFEPGDEFKRDLNLSKLYRFDKKGKYYVEISRNDSEQINGKTANDSLGKIEIEVK